MSFGCVESYDASHDDGEVEDANDHFGIGTGSRPPGDGEDIAIASGGQRRVAEIDELLPLDGGLRGAAVAKGARGERFKQAIEGDKYRA